MNCSDTAPAMSVGPDMNCPVISVIVPVYKVENYLRECLDSILAQTFTDWECILVDDGSPDGSGKICDEYAGMDCRFKVIHRENGGLSAARNTGIAASRGAYISFVDSDDVIHRSMLEHMYGLICDYNADVAQVSYENLYITGCKSVRLADNIIILDRAAVARELMKNKMIPSYMWIKLFKREVISQPFPEGLVFEDLYTLTSWAPNIYKMVISPEILYSYRQRSSSIVNSDYSHNRIEYAQAIIKRARKLHGILPSAISENMVEKTIWKGMIVAGKNIARYVKEPHLRATGVGQLHELSKTLPVPSIAALGLKMWWRAQLLLKSPETFIANMRMIYMFNSHKRHRTEKMFS